MSAVFWFFLGAFITAALWFMAAWFEEWRENRERIRRAEEEVLELFFGEES